MYTLEVIAHDDGFKDYDEKVVTIKKYYIETIFPNPSNNQGNLTVNYEASTANSAHLNITNVTTNITSTTILNPSQTSISISASTLIAGTYQVYLVCDGITKDSKTLNIY